VFCIVSGVIVAAGLFWLKIAVPAWHDFEYASRPHLPAPPRPLDDLNNLLVKRNLARGGGIILADTPIKVRGDRVIALEAASVGGLIRLFAMDHFYLMIPVPDSDLRRCSLSRRYGGIADIKRAAGGLFMVSWAGMGGGP